MYYMHVIVAFSNLSSHAGQHEAQRQRENGTVMNIMKIRSIYKTGKVRT